MVFLFEQLCEKWTLAEHKQQIKQETSLKIMQAFVSFKVKWLVPGVNTS